MFAGKVVSVMDGNTGSIISACCGRHEIRSVIQITD